MQLGLGQVLAREYFSFPLFCFKLSSFSFKLCLLRATSSEQPDLLLLLLEELRVISQVAEESQGKKQFSPAARCVCGEESLKLVQGKPRGQAVSSLHVCKQAGKRGQQQAAAAW